MWCPQKDQVRRFEANGAHRSRGGFRNGKMSHFCLLRDPENYVADKVDLSADKAERDYWLDHFADHFTETLNHALTQYGRTARKDIAAAGASFSAIIAKLRDEPTALGDGKLSIMQLCKARGEVLQAHGIPDAFGKIKQRENASAMELYTGVVGKLHAMAGAERWLALVRSVFAGNIFDLGSASTMHLATEGTDFLSVLGQLKPRPWRVDDFDRLAEDLPDSPPTNWGKAVIFVDNAGCDFILGVMPLVRELALCGTAIVLAANELPSLNDMTVDETIEVVEQLAKLDEDLAALIRAEMFEVVSTGNDMPVIDLSEVPDELNEAAADAELVILEGMGRGVESNFDATFTVDVLRLAMLKDERVAAGIGGEVFDCVCKYDRKVDPG